MSPEAMMILAALRRPRPRRPLSPEELATLAAEAEREAWNRAVDERKASKTKSKRVELSDGVTMPAEDFHKKGAWLGLCNRSACLAPGANWWNSGTRAYYCETCADSIDRDPRTRRLDNPRICSEGRPDDQDLQPYPARV